MTVHRDWARYVVTFNPADDLAGLRRMSLADAEKLMAFIALRNMRNARIVFDTSSQESVNEAA